MPLQEVVPPAELARLRTHVEVMYQRFYDQIWTNDAVKGQTPDSENPRVQFERVISPDESYIFDFICGASTQGVSHQMLAGDDPNVQTVPVETAMLTNPRHDYGPWKWHRDVIPSMTGPLMGTVAGFMMNRPGYVQWNIPLYDDDTLWVCPGSHKRPATEAEDADMEAKAQLSARFDGRDPSHTHSGPIGDAVPVPLKAGDGVVYFQSILHWGSDYTDQKGLRRTLHFGYRSFANGFWPQIQMPTWDSDIVPRLSQRLAPQFEHWLSLLEEERQVVKAALLAVGARDRSAFLGALGKLNSNPATNLMALALLRVHASGGGTIHRPMRPLEGEPDEVLAAVESGFVALDRALQHEGGEAVLRHGYLTSPTPHKYEYNDLPANWSVETFCDSWDSNPGQRLDAPKGFGAPPKKPRWDPIKGVVNASPRL